jgi:2-phospho-L-lactate transferase/gluconeogenesis factor (CofD/UPF0052 family)
MISREDTPNNKFDISIFSGGRGAASIISSLVNIEEIKLTIILNAYDDGLSTGVLRKLLPGMLGPSDVRKTFSTVLGASNDHGNKLISDFLEYRIGKIDTGGNAWLVSNSNPGESQKNLWNGFDFVNSYLDRFPRGMSREISRWLTKALVKIEEAVGIDKMPQTIHDMAIGNLIFVGTYLENNDDFNKVISVWSDLFNLRAKVLNVTTGENRILVANKMDGTMLFSEAEIVSKHKSKGKIGSLYLLKDYLDQDQSDMVRKINYDQQNQWLRSLESLPSLNPLVSKALKDAQMIIYGPGTQHSSLLPSYMTLGLVDVIAANTIAEKIFISNIALDFDIQEETLESIFDKVIGCMNIGAIRSFPFVREELITRSIISSLSELKFQNKDNEISTFPIKDISYGKWNIDEYKHDGEKVSRALLTIASMNSELFFQESLISLSIIVPVLNEMRTLPRVLSDVITFDWLAEGIVPQIIVVDGGSKDGSWDFIKKVNGITPLSIENSKILGRGAAIRAGIQMASGDLVVTFPADDEYEVSSLLDVIKVLDDLEKGIVFGSRSTFCVDTDEQLKTIYGGKNYEFFLSKWGGFLLSSISAVKYRRWVSDPLTSIKGFKSLDLMPLSMKGNSLNWDTRVITESAKNGIPIIEVPVIYKPRSRAEGKKTSIISGLKALYQLLRSH